MPVEIYLERLDKNLKSKKISPIEWEKCVDSIENIKLSKDETGNLQAVECFCEPIQDWIPIFWLHKNGSGSMREEGFFKYEISFEKAIEIAAYLNAFILGEEGIIFYEPNYGVLYDETDNTPQILLELDDLIEHQVYKEEDINQAITTVLKKKEAIHSNKKQEYIIHRNPLLSRKKVKKWWEFWK